MTVKRDAIVIDLTSDDDLLGIESTKRHRGTWTGVSTLSKKFQRNNSTGAVETASQTTLEVQISAAVIKCPICLEVDDAVSIANNININI